LRADPDALPALYAALKETPGLAGVSLREANLATFRAILDRSFAVSVAIDIAFAGLIAFGLVYNGARVALAERATELATLRVLGFTRGETAGLLLGEQAALTLAAVPLGLALGTGLAAWFAARLSTDLYRVPFVMTGATLGLAVAVTLACAIVSGALVGWRVRRFDLIAVLKARE
jgi:putative ABC transport system permease protein